jgi:hypothetical protein
MAYSVGVTELSIITLFRNKKKHCNVSQNHAREALPAGGQFLAQDTMFFSAGFQEGVF